MSFYAQYWFSFLFLFSLFLFVRYSGESRHRCIRQGTCVSTLIWSFAWLWGRMTNFTTFCRFSRSYLDRELKEIFFLDRVLYCQLIGLKKIYDNYTFFYPICRSLHSVIVASDPYIVAGHWFATQKIQHGESYTSGDLKSIIILPSIRFPNIHYQLIQIKLPYCLTNEVICLTCTYNEIIIA